MHKKLPLIRAIFYILLSLIVVAFLGTGCIRGYGAYRNYVQKSPSMAITEIIQSSGTTERLPTAYLSEMLGLSIDTPTQLPLFDTAKAQARLLQCPLLKSAIVKKRRPHTLVVRYLMRTPIALFQDISNGALDEHGVVFPLSPFYAPKKLPAFYLGEEVSSFGKQITSSSFSIACTLLSLLRASVNMQTFQIVSIDTSDCNHPSLGRRQIVVVIAHDYGRHYVRLHPKQYEESLANYLEMQGELLFQERESYSGTPQHKVIDLRIPGYAYVDATR